MQNINEENKPLTEEELDEITEALILDFIDDANSTRRLIHEFGISNERLRRMRKKVLETYGDLLEKGELSVHQIEQFKRDFQCLPSHKYRSDMRK